MHELGVFALDESRTVSTRAELAAVTQLQDVDHLDAIRKEYRAVATIDRTTMPSVRSSRRGAAADPVRPGTQAPACSEPECVAGCAGCVLVGS